MDKDASKVVMIHDVKLDEEYTQWLNEIKARYRNAQIKAAVKVNAEQLLFNWQLGQDLVIRKAEERWGSGIVEQVSLDLQAEFPGSKGFSTTNLWYMKQWYQFYAAAIPKLQQLVGELQRTEQSQDHGIDLPGVFMRVPWGHHIQILSKCKNIDEAIFYIVHCASEGWSRQALMNCIKADYYHTSGGAITNFSEILPTPQRELAQAITKP